MNSRKEEIYKKRNMKRVKLLIGTLFLSIGLGSSITVAFADQDISELLGSWFSIQQAKSIEAIENAILSEKEIQMQRLKEELQIEINDAKEQLNQYTEEEKRKRVAELQVHADELIKNFKVDNLQEKETINNELNFILHEAIRKMDEVHKTVNVDEKPLNETPPDHTD